MKKKSGEIFTFMASKCSADFSERKDQKIPMDELPTDNIYTLLV